MLATKGIVLILRQARSSIAFYFRR